MSQPELTLDEEVLSPDIFSDVETMIANNPMNSDESSSTSIGINEPEPSDDIPEWKGMSIDEIRKGLGIYDCQELPPITHSPNHTILISLPLPSRGPPKPHPAHQVDKWSQGYVRMPHSTHSLYPIEQGNAGRRCRNRWELIQESLLQSFVSSHQLETAILSYNHIHAQRWDFTALHHFFSEVIEEEETNLFFEVLMPKMVQLALQLPVLITGPLPLLERHTNGTISLSQLQVASLLANAFFCTFPRRNSTNPQSEYATYPYINFNRLFSAFKEEKRHRCESVMEKMKCIFHYFRRVTSKAPEGVITIQRRYIPKQDCPKWDQQDQKLPPLHITSRGNIETDGAGLLQVDFANKYVGGGVLGLGCVQEEIRFAICPELMVSMLVAEALDDTEALVISGIERYSKHEGYSNNFKWAGDFVDETPRDNSGRRLTSIVAIDALHFKQPASQFNISNITRELNKAYVGFVGCESIKERLPAIATGNWGCGAFHGNPKLKVLLQLMAAAVAGRSMVYFTSGDTSLRDEVAEMYWHFVQHNIDIAHLFSLLVQYQESANLDFYRFLYNRSKIKLLSKYFTPKNKSPPTEASTKHLNGENEFSSSKESTFKRSKSLKFMEKRTLHSGIRQLGTEEERIQGWLADFDEDSAINENMETFKEEAKIPKDAKESEKQTNRVIQKNDTKDQNDDDDTTEKKRKNSLWQLLEDKVQSKTMYDRRFSGLDLLDTKQELISNHTNNDQDVLTMKNRSPTTPIEANNKSESNQNLRSTDSCKRNSPGKKAGQRKISDFFQRAS